MMLLEPRVLERDDPQSPVLLTSLPLEQEQRRRTTKSSSSLIIKRRKEKKNHEKKEPYRHVHQGTFETISLSPSFRGECNDDGVCTRKRTLVKGPQDEYSQEEASDFDAIFWNKRKSVTFPSRKGLERHQEAPECFSTTCASDLWYQPEDFARFRCLAQLEASSTCLTEEASQYLELLEQSISIAAHLAQEVCKYRKRGHREAVLWDRIFQRLDMRYTGLTHWCLESPYRGLECLASKPLRRAKYSTRKHMIRELSRTTDYYAAPTVAPRTHKRRSLSPEELAEKLEQRSQFSRLFARMVGIADELSVRHWHERHGNCSQQSLY